VPVATTREGRLYIITFAGTYSPDEVIGSFRSIVDADDFPKNARLLLDLRNADSVLERSISDLKLIAEHFVDNARSFDDRVALVVDGLARYGLMRMAAAWVERDWVSAPVFRDMAEARRWVLEAEMTHSPPTPP
jgi:hypothetical protein